MVAFRKRIDAKKIVSFVGTLLMLVSLGFMARRIIEYGLDFSLLASSSVVAALLGVASLEAAGIVGASINFRALVKNVSGVTVLRPLAMVVYTVSNLYKYIPGGVMYVAGRHRMVVETEDLSHAKLVFATVTEGVLIVIGAILAALIFSFGHSISYVRQLDILPVFLLVLGILLILAAPPLYLLRRRLKKWIKRFWETVEILRLSVLAKRLGFAALLMFLWGITFVAVMAILGQPMDMRLATTVLGLYLLAWLAGFLTPGAPSGIGIREAVMLMFLSDIVYTSILLSAMIIHRVVTMLGDVIAYGVCLAYDKNIKQGGHL